jgi:hypothetical protein
VAQAPARGAPELNASRIVPAAFAGRIAGQHGDAGRAWIEAGVLLLEWVDPTRTSGELDRLTAAAFAGCAGVDVQRARRWAQAYLVEQALWCREHQPEVVAYVDRLVDLLG